MTTLESAEHALKGACILVVEDDFIILMELEFILFEAGAQTVDMCRTVEEALRVAQNRDHDAALLDIRLGRETSASIARCLTRLGVPFAFFTGQAETDPMRAEWPDCKIVAKPASANAIVTAVAGLLRRP